MVSWCWGLNSENLINPPGLAATMLNPSVTSILHYIWWHLAAWSHLNLGLATRAAVPVLSEGLPDAVLRVLPKSGRWLGDAGEAPAGPGEAILMQQKSRSLNWTNFIDQKWKPKKIWTWIFNAMKRFCWKSSKIKNNRTSSKHRHHLIFIPDSFCKLKNTRELPALGIACGSKNRSTMRYDPSGGVQR